jgi:hypothetical protein
MQEKSVLLSPPINPNKIDIEGVAANNTVAGPVVPLVDISMEVLPTTAPGIYPRTALIAQPPQLASAAQLANILTRNVTYFDYSGKNREGISIQVADPQQRGLLLTRTLGPIFDLTPGTGADFGLFCTEY